MPKIPPQILKCTFYLYPTADDAERGQNCGGTGFLVGVPSKEKEGVFYLIAISNWHVVCSSGCSVIRVNKIGGGVDIYDFQPDQWEFLPGGHDVAGVLIELRSESHDVSFIPPSLLITQEKVIEFEIGPGENAFMAGRFIDHDGRDTNRPALRFGHISMMPEMMRQPNGISKPNYCIDMHSRTGFSGSPVFAFRTATDDLTRPNHIGSSTFIGLLGIHWGQFPEIWEISSGSLVPQIDAANLVTDGQLIKGLSGMTCVAPADAVLAITEIPKFRKVMEVSEQIFAMNKALGLGNIYPVSG